MKNLQMKYNLMHLFYWVSYCAVYGYVAMYLQFKGMSNTLVGMVTGIAALLTVVTSPFLSGLIGKIKGLTITKLMVLTYIGQFVCWAMMTFLPVPPLLLMIIYIILINLIAANVPLLSSICMNYLHAGEYVNFGISRGIGSVAYASSAVLIGRLIDFINPNVLAPVHLVASLALFAVLYSLPKVEIKESKAEKGVSLVGFVSKYKKYMLILIAHGIQFASVGCLSVYLINIVNNLGGNASFYGIAVFFMAASEMPFMAVCNALLKRFNAEKILLTASLLFVVRNSIVCFAPNLIILMFGLLFQGASYGLFTATITNYANMTLDSQDGMTGQTMIAMMTTGLGSMLGSIVGGILQDAFGIVSMYIFVIVLVVTGFALMFFVLYKDWNKAPVHRV